MLIKVPYGEGKNVLIESSTEEEFDVENLSKISSSVTQVNQSLEQVSITIVDMSRVMIGAFENLDDSKTKSSAKAITPAKATLEFGICFSAEGDIYVVKASGEASLKVSVEWEFK
ncbi:MAG: hypothetical protein LC108_04040 [Anaerolineales bacterium]|jgi:hypothetical protein|nr:hypothetical protein [Anaerolineales bacterium]